MNKEQILKFMENAQDGESYVLHIRPEECKRHPAFEFIMHKTDAVDRFIKIYRQNKEDRRGYSFKIGKMMIFIGLVYY